MIIKLLILCGFLFPVAMLAQEEKTPSASGIKLDFKLPFGVGNQSFAKVMSDLVDLDLQYNYHFEKIRLIAGAGVKYGYWEVEKNHFPNEVITGKLEVISPYINIGYRQKISEQLFCDLELNSGFGRILSSSNQCAKSYTQDAVILTPKVNVYLKASDLLYFGAALSYTNMGASFTPTNLCLEAFPAKNNDHNKGNYQYIAFGFGFYAILPSGR